MTDGFTGNVVLKLMEGVSRTMIERRARRAPCPRRAARLGGLLLRPALRGVRDQLDPEVSGGAYLLGLRKLGVVPHGRFSASRLRAGDPARGARRASEDVVGRTHEALEAAGALRRVPEASGAGSSVPPS